MLPMACDAPRLDVREVGQSAARGHAIRDRALHRRSERDPLRTAIAIIGAGAAGASAAWRLHRAGFDDVHVFELEDLTGGTARAGSMPRSAYPMGAHYLPSPHRGFTSLLTLLGSLGMILGTDPDGRPEFDPTIVCRGPVERHRYRGRWHDGIYPHDGQTRAEADEWRRFQDHLLELDDQRGPDGRRLFDLPIDHSSRALRHLDRISMAQYLDEHGFRSWRLRWLVDYMCRDDYGCTLETTSAFAALHHELARGLEDVHDRVLLTWPQGNAALVSAMLERSNLGERLHCQTAAVGIDPTRGEFLAVHLGNGPSFQVQADVILWASPRFVLPYALTTPTPQATQHGLSYAPWLVANVFTTTPPAGIGSPLAWDNVPVGAPHLGYVVANHQESTEAAIQPGTVLTLYHPFIEPPDDARRSLLAGTTETWSEHVVQAFEGMHPGITPKLRRIDIARWGHAMVRAVPGLLFGDRLLQAAAPLDRVIPCAADVGGLPLFEQSFCHGVRAAEAALGRLGTAVEPFVTENVR